MTKNSLQRWMIAMVLLLPHIAHSHQKPWYKMLWPWSGTTSVPEDTNSAVQSVEITKSSQRHASENVFICRDGKYLYVERDGKRLKNSQTLIFFNGAERCKCDRQGRDELQNRCEVR